MNPACFLCQYPARARPRMPVSPGPQAPSSLLCTPWAQTPSAQRQPALGSPVPRLPPPKAEPQCPPLIQTPQGAPTHAGAPAPHCATGASSSCSPPLGQDQPLPGHEHWPPTSLRPSREPPRTAQREAPPRKPGRARPAPARAAAAPAKPGPRRGQQRRGTRREPDTPSHRDLGHTRSPSSDAVPSPLGRSGDGPMRGHGTDLRGP